MIPLYDPQPVRFPSLEAASAFMAAREKSALANPYDFGAILPLEQVGDEIRVCAAYQNAPYEICYLTESPVPA